LSATGANAKSDWSGSIYSEAVTRYGKLFSLED
jgi:hypothetical protein